MGKPKGINQKAQYRAHSIRLSRYANRVQSVYDTLNKEVAQLVIRSGYDGSEPFKWSNYPAANRKFDEIRTQFVMGMRGIIYSGTSEEWRQSNLAQDLLADKALKFYGIKREGKRAKVYYQTNSNALKAFQQRKDNGLNLSHKLWNQSSNYKEELEYCLSSAIDKGTSAVKLSKRLSKYLTDFPSLKKDYKEKFGQAVACKDCEYRSIRLARSEINMAYRAAEQERWKQFDFVLGYEVKLTQNGHHVPDICDDLAGKYPKDFVFKGWHPNCMCYVIPILKTEEQFWNNEEVNDVKAPPSNFMDWLEENTDRIDKAKERDVLPYWYTENPKYVRSIQKEKFEMTREIRAKLIQRGFDKQGLISVEDYKSSSAAGFDVLTFDSRFESIMDKHNVMLNVKELRRVNDKNVSLRYKGYTEKGEAVELIRYFRVEEINGERRPVVKHELFMLPEDLQGKGISKALFRELIYQYENAGIQKAYIYANITQGALAWARYGALAEKSDIKFIAKAAQINGKISQEEYFLITSYLSKYVDMIPMQDIAYAPYGKRLLEGMAWNGYIDLANKAQMDYLHTYLGIAK